MSTPAITVQLLAHEAGHFYGYLAHPDSQVATALLRNDGPDHLMLLPVTLEPETPRVRSASTWAAAAAGIAAIFTRSASNSRKVLNLRPEWIPELASKLGHLVALSDTDLAVLEASDAAAFYKYVRAGIAIGWAVALREDIQQRIAELEEILKEEPVVLDAAWLQAVTEGAEMPAWTPIRQYQQPLTQAAQRLEAGA